MKKFLLLVVASLTMMCWGCTQFDTTGIWDAINDLEEEQEKMQEQLDAQQTLLNALANSLTIVSITPTTEGFLLTFSDGSTITVKHGEKGEKGDTGAQGEKGDKGDKGDTGAQGEKGDKGDKGDTGEKGEDGADGKDGENGKDGADGDSFFESVTWDDEYVYFTLADGSVITIPLSKAEAKPQSNEIWYTATKKVTPNATNGFGANIVSNEWNSLTLEGVITFDGKVTSIGNSAFSWCSSLASITIPEGVTSIGESAFLQCSSLVSITIPHSVTSIGDYAFLSCWNLAEFEGKFASEDGRCLIIDGVLNSFACGCGLTEYTIPDGVTSIGNEAFLSCSSLESITIPDSVTEIGYSAFSGCTSLAEFNGKFASEDGKCLIVDGVLNSFACGCGLTEYTIPDGVTSIGNEAFLSCLSLESITIPHSVTSIGSCAFSWCFNLRSVTIGNGVTSIGSCAFSYCESLAEVYCKATTPPMGGDFMFGGNASGRKIYVSAESVEAYKTAEGWSDYAGAIVGYNF